MKPIINIIKIGGHLIQESEQLEIALDQFSKIKGPKILIHGGGRSANQMLQALNIEPQMIDGRRITDAATLKIVTMVYAGLVNKKIVSQLQSKGCNALGLSGTDGNLILAKKREIKKIDYGFTGDIIAINNQFLEQLIQKNISPVCCAITHDGKGQLLNTNADTIAASIAKALTKKFQVRLKFCFEKSGVCRNPNLESSLIKQLSFTNYQNLIDEKIITDGMIPKLDMAFDALNQQVKAVSICGLNAINNPDAVQTHLVL